MSELIEELKEWSKTYEITFQFWPDQCNVWIAKDGVEYAFYNAFKVDEVVQWACEYLRGINPPKKEHYKIPNSKLTPKGDTSE